jgi:hypothetical protein
MSLLDNLMAGQRHGQSLSDYVHYMRQTFDVYNEICQMVDGSAAIHPHNLGLLMLRLPSLLLSLLAAVHTTVEVTLPVVLAVVADYPTSAAPTAAWTTSYPHALPRMTLSFGGPSRRAK